MHFQKFISLFLALVLSLSLCLNVVPVSYAADSSNWIFDWLAQIGESNLAWSAEFGQTVSADLLLSGKVGEKTPDEFNAISEYYRSSFYNSFCNFMDDASRALSVWHTTVNGFDFCMVKLDPVTQRYRLYNNRYGFFIERSDGQYPWCSRFAYEAWQSGGTSSEPPSEPSDPPSKPSTLTGKLVDARTLTFDRYNLQSEAFLLSVANANSLVFSPQTIKKDGKDVGVYVAGKVQSGIFYVYCNYAGEPYVAYRNVGETALGNGTTNNYNQVIDKTTNSPTYNQTTNIYNTTTGPDYSGVLVDINEGILNIYDELGNLDTQDIYNVSYDYSDHSYNVTTYDTTYNIENNYYEYNYSGKHPVHLQQHLHHLHWLHGRVSAQGVGALL